MPTYPSQPDDIHTISTAHTNIKMESYFPVENDQGVIEEITGALAYLGIFDGLLKKPKQN